MTKLNKLKANIPKLVNNAASGSKPLKNSRAIVDMKNSTEKYSIEELILQRSKKVERFMKSCKLHSEFQTLNENSAQNSRGSEDVCQNTNAKLLTLVISIIDREHKESLNYAQKFLIISHYLKCRDVGEI